MNQMQDSEEKKKYAKLYIAQQKLQVYFAKHPISQKIHNISTWMMNKRKILNAS